MPYSDVQKLPTPRRDPQNDAANFCNYLTSKKKNVPFLFGGDGFSVSPQHEITHYNAAVDGDPTTDGAIQPL